MKFVMMHLIIIAMEILMRIALLPKLKGEGAVEEEVILEAAEEKEPEEAAGPAGPPAEAPPPQAPKKDG